MTKFSKSDKVVIEFPPKSGAKQIGEYIRRRKETNRIQVQLSGGKTMWYPEDCISLVKEVKTEEPVKQKQAPKEKAAEKPKEKFSKEVVKDVKEAEQKLAKITKMKSAKKLTIKEQCKQLIIKEWTNEDIAKSLKCDPANPLDTRKALYEEGLIDEKLLYLKNNGQSVNPNYKFMNKPGEFVRVIIGEEQYQGEVVKKGLYKLNALDVFFKIKDKEYTLTFDRKTGECKSGQFTAKIDLL